MSGFTKAIKKFPRTFWIANTMELFERWAWYGFFMVLALYLTGSKDTGALGFSQEQKGYLMGTVVGLLYFLPVITGAIADKFGYKKVLVVAYVILSSGYLIMGYVSSYTMVWLAFLYIGAGAALFKPVISATISKTTDDETSSIGFGLFYMIVNVGAFIGPVFAAKLRLIDWVYVFWMSSAIILINLFLLLVFFKEPQSVKKEEPLGKTIIAVFRNILSALRDYKFLIFLFIIIGFWTMYNQLFYTLPVFIEQWVDTSVIYNALYSVSPALASAIGTDNGTIAPEMLTNIDALYIVIFQVLVSSLVMKYKPLNTMVTGILIASIGIGFWFVTQNGFYLFLSIFIFAVGEMSSSPKILEYIGKIAPKDKVALYMGCYFLPMSGGNFFAGLLSGNVYGSMSDKFNLLKREIASRGLEIQSVSETFTQNDYIKDACSLLKMNETELTAYLWSTYHPSNIWIVFSGIGLFAVICLALYDRFLLSKQETV